MSNLEGPSDPLAEWQHLVRTDGSTHVPGAAVRRLFTQTPDAAFRAWSRSQGLRVVYLAESDIYYLYPAPEPP